MEELSYTLKHLPDEPGVYLYRDANGTVIYVGKAKVLKNRVRSYFHSTGLNAKTRMLVSRISSIEYVVTANEAEALLLENNLIKKYKPKYNILLKDDKGYPYLRMDPSEVFPRLTVARRLAFDGALYFGPYHGATGARAIAEIAMELFPLRTCQYDFSKERAYRPCVKMQIGRCPGPCVNRDRDSYQKNVNRVITFLRGNQADALGKLREKMLEASEKQDYERAAEIRNRLQEASTVLSGQKVVLEKNENIDVAAVILQDAYAVTCSMFVRGGRLTGVTITEWPEVEYLSEPELLEKYLIQQYTSPTVLPTEIVCGFIPEDVDMIRSMILDANRHSVKITVPSKGKKHDLYLMALRNARERLEKSTKRIQHNENRVTEGLQQLQQVLTLPEVPHRMECFDISHIQGTDTVASMVVFTDGFPDTKEYRRFKIRSAENNDFASMQEVTSRRYRSGLNQEKGFEKMPDLIIIDGGKGQLHSARQMLDELGLSKIPMIGLAKKMEEIYLPGQSLPYLLPYSSPALQILQSIRDEAHRFAITFHRSLRGKHSLVSVLDQIPGIGKVRKKALYKAFSTTTAIKEATLEDLKTVPGMNEPSAQAVYQYFQQQKNAL